MKKDNFSKYLFSSILFFCLSANAGNMVIQYDFEETESSKIQENKVKSVSGFSGKGGGFSGKEYIVFSDKIPINTRKMTIQLDFYSRKDTGTLVSCFHENGNQRSFNLGISKGILNFSVNSTGKSGTTQSASMPIKLNQWNHAYAEFVPGRLKLTVNGKTVTAQGPEKIKITEKPILVGRYATGKLLRMFDGIMDNLNILCSPEPIGSDNLLGDASQWENIEGKWQFSNGEVFQTAKTEGKYASLKWKGLLPTEPFRIDFELSLIEKGTKDFFPAAYVVLKSDPSSQTGFGFGLERKGNKQLLWREFPSDRRINSSKLQSGKKFGKRWQKISVVVYGACHEVFYSSQVVMRGYKFEYQNQKGLVLKTNMEAGFRNIRITPLKDLFTPIPQFKTAVTTEVASTRPVFKWEPLGLNKHEDFIYHIRFIKDGKMVLEDMTSECQYRPANGLSEGAYEWHVEAKNFYGTVYGGKISGKFSITSSTPKAFDAIKMKTATVRHFDRGNPELVWEWKPDRAVDHIEIIRDGEVIANSVVSGKNTLAVIPKKKLYWGLNTFTIKFFHGKQLIETIDTYVIRTKLPVRHTIREDGVLLRDGKAFTPIVTYRDPSDDRKQTAGIEEAGFNVTHSYYFEGAHHYNIKKDKLPEQLSHEMLKTLISDAREYLRLCDAKGIKVALGMRRAWIYNQKLDFIREYVAALMGEPGLLTWYLYDEPDYVGVPMPSIRKAYETIKNIDPFHPVSIIYAASDVIPRYARSCDILWAQAYHEKPSDVMHHIDTLFQMRKASVGFCGKDNAPNPLASWAILGPFDLKIQEKQHSFEQHRPNPEEIVAQTYAAIISQARGIVYYWLPKNHYDIRKDTPHIWKAIIESAKLVNTVYPYFLEEGKELEVPSDRTGIVARVKKLKSGKTIMILLNTNGNQTDKTLTWEFCFSNKVNIRKVTGKGQFELLNNKLTVKLDGYEGIVLFADRNRN